MKSKRKIVVSLANWGLVLIGAIVCGVGIWASGVSIHDAYNTPGMEKPWTCGGTAVNSGNNI